MLSTALPQWRLPTRRQYTSVKVCSSMGSRPRRESACSKRRCEAGEWDFGGFNNCGTWVAAVVGAARWGVGARCESLCLSILSVHARRGGVAPGQADCYKHARGGTNRGHPGEGEVVVCPDQRCLQAFTDTSSLRIGTRAGVRRLAGRRFCAGVC
jgi:hypothetical protein